MATAAASNASVAIWPANDQSRCRCPDSNHVSCAKGSGIAGSRTLRAVPPRIWIAEPDEAEPVARLLAAFRTWYGKDWPSDNAFHATVERLIEQRDTEYLLAAPHDDAPPAAVAQLRYRLSVWTAAEDCWL